MKSNLGRKTKEDRLKTLTKIVGKTNSKVLNLRIRVEILINFDFVKYVY